MLSWDFDKRRTAQPILPFLYLGASATARDATFLSATGITFLLAVRSSYAVAARPKYLDPATYPTTGNRNTATFDVDTPFDFITKVKPAIKSVVDYLEANTTKPLISANDINAKILVYCESGNDRSAAFVVAFLMVVYCLDAATAVQLVQSQRYCIYIEDGFKRMLMDFDQILQAERQVVSAHMQAGQGSSPYQQSNQAPTTTKRAFAAYSGDGEMGGCVDSVEDSRLGMAPFADA
ncbi:uncharacterized protein HMPREF1541_07394 [Cyphellophora europaea CBS 101466]|uniref:Tyrosine specific protein phosphatases domain-containing protein n=1 Tax=Cyphellophora europaea (strain CBS 101466) TaxID=1220924 RepID=W2RMN5_CYPE1|nr:uncharacterized protein HMPREF1541_07394 [Cyphellophora europaea CBS 101466]ETN37771.1 hypothetical protein HMPREF1541_07394 [Cyphellophora europaea CBS 101466]